MLTRMRNTSSQLGKVVWVALMMVCLLIGALPKQALASGGPPYVPLYPPTNLVAKLGFERVTLPPESVTLRWAPSITPKNIDYKVYQYITHKNGTNTVKVHRVSKGSLNGVVSFFVGINDNEIKYEFKVTAVLLESGVESSPSNIVSVEWGMPPIIDRIDLNLNASAVNDLENIHA